MSQLNKKRRFHIIARLGNIPGFTRKTVKFLQTKRKNFFVKKISRHKKDEKPSLNLDFLTNLDLDVKSKNKLQDDSEYDSQDESQNDSKDQSKQDLLKNLPYQKMNSLRHFYYLYKYNMDKIQKNQNYKNGKNTLEYIKFLKLVNLLDGNITYTSLDKYSRFYYYFREKQRAKYHYRLKDYQLCTFSRKCCKTKKVKSFALDKLLNSRLDVVLFYLGISPTMKAARQLINHRHISINGKTINKPSYICKENDRILYKMDKEKNNEEIIFSYSDIKRLTSNKILNINTTALVDYYIKKL